MTINWFLKLRIYAFFVLFVILVALWGVYDLDLKWLQIVALLLAIPLSNIVVNWYFLVDKNHDRIAISLLSLDTLILYGFIYFTGGPSNPLSILFLLQVVLAAVMLGKKWTWIFYFFTSVCFMMLFFWHDNIPQLSHAHHGPALSLHLQGMFLAYLLVGALTAYFLTNLVKEISIQKDKVRKMYFNNERLTALTTLSANTAHELGTPLATINLVSDELNSLIAAKKKIHTTELIDDLAIISQETKRCKESIEELCSSSGIALGETNQWTNIEEFLVNQLKDFSDLSKISIEQKLENMQYSIPVKSFGHVVKSMMKNAIEANHAANSNEPVNLEVFENDTNLIFDFTDSGPGFNQEILDSIGEPFISTKEQGMGLGIYLAKLTVESLNGEVEFENFNEGGAKVRVMIAFEKKDQDERTEN